MFFPLSCLGILCILSQWSGKQLNIKYFIINLYLIANVCVLFDLWDWKTMSRLKALFFFLCICILHATIPVMLILQAYVFNRFTYRYLISFSGNNMDHIVFFCFVLFYERWQCNASSKFCSWQTSFSGSHFLNVIWTKVHLSMDIKR